MSKARGTQHLRGRKRGRAHKPADDLWHGVMYAASPDETHLEEAKKVTHDNLIGQLGEWRLGGVRWSIIPAGAPANSTLDRLVNTERVVQPHELGPGDAQPAAMIGYLEQLRAFLADNPDGYLVIATAPAVRPDQRT